MTTELNETSYRIRYEIDLGGVLQTTGEAFGAKTWLDHHKFGDQNAIKRVKSSMGVKWSTPTKALKTGRGQINRQFDDGRILYIWVDRGDTPVSKASAKPAYSQAIEDDLYNKAIADLLAGGDFDQVSSGLHHAINTHEQEEPIGLMTVRDMLAEMYQMYE